MVSPSYQPLRGQHLKVFVQSFLPVKGSIHLGAFLLLIQPRCEDQRTPQATPMAVKSVSLTFH
jgi:hypothetical protein